MSFLQRLRSPRQRDDAFLPSHMQYKFKTRFAMLGTVGSGKSTVASAIILTAQTLSARYPQFYARVLEGGTSNILTDFSTTSCFLSSLIFNSRFLMVFSDKFIWPAGCT